MLGVLERGLTVTSNGKLIIRHKINYSEKRNYFNMGTQLTHIINLLWTTYIQLDLEDSLRPFFSNNYCTVGESVYLGETCNPKCLIKKLKKLKRNVINLFRGDV
jgi:hypothetical protein